MQLLYAATLTTPDVEAAADRYERWLSYRIVERGRIAPELARSWGTPASGGRPYVVMQPESGASVYLRLVEGPRQRDYRPLRSYGWAAVEFCVQDVLAVNTVMERSPFDIIGPPRKLDGLPTIFPMQVRGPDQEIFYFTEIRGDLPGYDLPRAQVSIDRPFIVVLACSDLKASMEWCERRLALQTGREMQIEYTVLSHAFGLPAAHKHRLATGVHERDCFLELTQFPAGATARAGWPDELKPGFALATFAHPAMGRIEGDWIEPPRRHEGAFYGGRHAGTLAAPDGSLFELVEA